MYPVSVKGILFSPKGEVVLLLNQRKKWELPGDRLELGESSAQCLARELFEELNIQVRVGLPVDTYLFEVVPGKHVFISTYRCALAGPFDRSATSTSGSAYFHSRRFPRIFRWAIEHPSKRSRGSPSEAQRAKHER